MNPDTAKTPKFTRQDFQYLADWLRDEMPRAMVRTGCPVERLIESMANHLEWTNPNFDRERFVQAATTTGKDAPA